jgi:hypothetical protein
MPFDIKKIIEKQAVLSNNDINFLEDHVLGNNIPWYLNHSTVNGDGIFYLSHTLLHRYEDNPLGKLNSPGAEFFLKLIKELALKNNISINQFLRCSLNLSFHNKNDIGTIHVDHTVEHYNFIMYLEDTKNAGTIIYDDDKVTEKYRSESKKFNYLIFPGFFHAQLFPSLDEKRIVLVATFR